MRVGAHELRLLEHCSKVGPTSVREAADSFGHENGIGLTTVQQMMERLRKKLLLQRERVGGIWIYRAVESRETVLKGVVKDFVERTLGGSLEPFMLYLADPATSSGKGMDEVRRIVEGMDAGEKKGSGK